MSGDAPLWASLPMPALMIASDGVITRANPAAEDFLNLSARSLIGQSLWDMVMVDADLDASLARAWRDGGTLVVSDVDVGSGARVAERCNIQFAPMQDDPSVMIMLITPQMTAAKVSLKGSTQRAAKSAIGMAEMLAHEIKNPLAGITGSAQLLSMGLSGGDLELTDLIVAESRRIVQLLEQVEEFGNLAPPTLAPVNIHDVLDRARKSAQVSYAAHMNFVEDYDPSLPEAWADADKLLQALQNLIKNAAEAGEVGGSIKLRSYYDAGLRVAGRDGAQARLPLQIEVIDDGPGLPAGIASDVFEPFVSGRENGTGLGLALVSKLIGEMGGWIWVDSVPQRTVFRLALPMVPSAGGV